MPFGFVYIWYDRSAQLFYIGSHVGSPTDRYVSSSRWMNAAKRKRPNDFRRRILEWIHTPTISAVRAAEQRWLDMIRVTELATSENVKLGRHRYYNMKKQAAGGSEKGHTKVRQGSWNKGLTKDTSEAVARIARMASNTLKGSKQSHSHKENLSAARKMHWERNGHDHFQWSIIQPDGSEAKIIRIREFCEANDIALATVYRSGRTNRPIRRGRFRGCVFVKRQTGETRASPVATVFDDRDGQPPDRKFT